MAAVEPLTDAARHACAAVLRTTRRRRVPRARDRVSSARRARERTRETMKPTSCWLGLSASRIRSCPTPRRRSPSSRPTACSVKILTGDSDVVARHVCRQVGVGDEAIVTGDELDRLDDAALGHVAEQASVFTRVSPGAEEPDHPRVEAPRARGGLPRRRHQRRAVAARGRRRHFGDERDRRRARGGGHHPASSPASRCSTGGFSKDAARPAT